MIVDEDRRVCDAEVGQCREELWPRRCRAGTGLGSHLVHESIISRKEGSCSALEIWVVAEPPAPFVEKPAQARACCVCNGGSCAVLVSMEHGRVCSFMICSLSEIMTSNCD
ncbi:hypothetical protein MPTK1_6g14530 [Marchantia polymorpha subsp. ruderalis]|uniref:Uncharacterized protein n=2 Tax=Marchantia polymorpha TaxID=3197 RepID=A0AAF6BS07_MARPO|nr:hypothetical protein MARPO_0047s0107 [Marchantia polymorpha]BBN14791.1 hypothetical protein Mp_6g14530 [Marchantia polymorpha subsp. ruderalis]|eukprot:PTQ39135.1 hypothetical protein MARPO_0047s0107 [Marchantia polymorpha]